MSSRSSVRTAAHDESASAQAAPQLSAATPARLMSRRSSATTAAADSSAAAQASQAGAQNTSSAPSAAGTAASGMSTKGTDAAAGVSSLQPGSAESTTLVAELEATSRLVHQQSLQQAELLSGLERALSQLSEHRLLVQNPQATPGQSYRQTDASAASRQQDVLSSSQKPSNSLSVPELQQDAEQNQGKGTCLLLPFAICD